MPGDTQNGSSGTLRPDQQSTPYDPELARQARQAENRSASSGGGELEPGDSRNITGVGGSGTGTPGGADQQEGAARWSGDAQQAQEVAASQPDATTAAGQQPGIDRREIQAEQQVGHQLPASQRSGVETGEVWSGDAQPNPAASIEPSPEAQHMAAAHVPGFDQRQQPSSPQLSGAAEQQDLNVPQHSQASMKQTLKGMSQSLGGSTPEQQGFVDQQSASHGGMDQQNQSMAGTGQQEASIADGSGGQAGDDGQLAATHGIDVAAEQPGAQPTGAYEQQAQFDAGAGGQAGSGGQAGGGQGAGGSPADQVREHMEVVGADEVHLGTVDKVEGDRIKLTKADSGMGGHQGHHHYISRGLVAAVEGNRVRLSATAANAYGMEEEE